MANDVLAIGDVATIDLTVKNEAGALTDPATLDLTITPPAGVPVVKHLSDLTRLSLGLFHYDYPVTGVAGLYPWHAVSTLPDSVADGAFEVIASPEDTGDLVTPTHYQRITGDTTTPWPAVVVALRDAIEYAEGQCRREFEYGTYTETLDRFENGCVYPHATPLASVSDPVTAQLRLGGIYIGAWAGGTWPESLSPLPPQNTVTYAGGYHPYGSGHDPEMPVRLVRVICRIAFLALHPSSLVGQGVPANAKAAAVGDVSLSGDLSGLVVTDPSIERDLKRFSRRTAVQRTTRSF